MVSDASTSSSTSVKAGVATKICMPPREAQTLVQCGGLLENLGINCEENGNGMMQYMWMYVYMPVDIDRTLTP